MFSEQAFLSTEISPFFSKDNLLAMTKILLAMKITIGLKARLLSLSLEQQLPVALHCPDDLQTPRGA